MFLPSLPTVVGTTSLDAMGSLEIWDGDVTDISIIPNQKMYGFRPYCFDDGNKKWLCGEGQCCIQMSQRRVDALAISYHSNVTLRNATVHTTVVEGKLFWNVIVDDYPTTLVGVHPSRNDLGKMIDLFSGMTNWAKGAEQLGLYPKISLERDESIATIGAMNSKIPIWKANTLVDHWSFDFGTGFRNNPIMLVADVANEFVREPMSAFKCGLMTGSPPCQPWSILASELGLADSRGRTFLSVADTAEFLGVFVIDLENVAGIFQHPDWNEVVRYFWHRGYGMVHKSVDSLKGFLPTNRARANVIFVRCDFPHVPIPESLQLNGVDSVGAHAFGVLHDPLQVKDSMIGKMVQLTADDVEYLTEPRFFTKEVHQKVKAGLTPLEARAQHKNRALPCPTARYGSPSELSQQTLNDKKLIMVVFCHEGSIRWYSPFEFMAALGITTQAILPLSRALAYLMIGNTISPLHVALNLCRAMCCIGHEDRKFRSISYIVNRFAAKQIPLSKCEIQFDDEVMWMIPKQCQTIPRPIETSRNESQLHIQETLTESSKRSCDVGNEVIEQPSKRHCVGNRDDLTHVILMGREGFVHHKKIDSSQNMGEFVRDVGLLDFLLMIGDITYANEDVGRIQNRIAMKEKQVIMKSNQMKNIMPLFDPKVKHDNAMETFPCWFMIGDEIFHQKVSNEITLRGLQEFHGANIAVFVVPTNQHPPEPVTTSVQEVSSFVGVWVRCGKDGDIHQIWVHEPYNVGMLKLRYHKDGFQCHVVIGGDLLSDDQIVSALSDVVEVHYKSQNESHETVGRNGDDITMNDDNKHFLQDPTTVFIKPCEAISMGELVQNDVQQAILSMNVPCGHVVVTITSCNWCQTIVVSKGTPVRAIINKLKIQTEAVSCVKHKGFAIDMQSTCHRDMQLQVEFREQFVIVRFNMMRKVFALKIQPYHVGSDCKSMLSQHLGIPMSMMRLFHGFQKVADNDILWEYRGVLQARIFPLAGGSVLEQDENRCSIAMSQLNCSQVRGGNCERAEKSECFIPRLKENAAANCLGQANRSDEIIEVWFRSPVNGKLHHFKADRHQTLKQVHECLYPGLPVGSLFCNGTIVSHDSCCVSFAKSVIVSRFFPLKGGGGGKNGKGEGKGKQTNTAKANDFLAECLERRGVPKSESIDRAKKVVSVVGVDFILKHMEADDFWFHMKNEASKNMVRLILPQELKAWQQVKRAETKTNKSKAPTKGLAPALNPKDLQLRIDDFKAEGKAMQVISEEGIKPDCTGVCLMAPSSAKNFLPAKRLTADGLAIVTLGVLSSNDPQIQFIVTSFSGEDFVARGNMYQFGDTVVTHNPSGPTATVAEVASSVVEVVIGKDCPWWSVAAVDAVAAVAKLDTNIKVREAIIGQWKFRPYSPSRVPTNSEHAAHIHGYIRVRDNMLDSILAVSGQHAIFFNTRIGGGGKDDRFSFIPLPDMDYDEAKCKAQTIQFSLGIVKGRGHFTLRCRRENYRKVMKQINPDMVFGESSDDESDLDAKFRLEGIHFQTTAHELTTALKTLNWKAKAIRAMGASSWLVLANAAPKSRSFTLNNQLVVVKDMVPRVPLAQFVVSKPLHASVESSGMSSSSTVSQGPVSSRMDQIEAGLDEKIQKIVERQMQESSEKIDRIEETLSKQELAQTELQIQFEQQQKELTGVSTKITNVAADLQTTQASMLASFEMLLKNEMKSLHQKLSSEREESEEKRRRKE